MKESVLINVRTLGEWRAEMELIDNSAMDTISNVSHLLQELDEEWKGDSATAFIEMFDEKIKEIRLIHEKMYSLSDMFHNVVETASRE